MLLDVPGVLAGIGLAILGFVVVIAVCLVVLRLLTVVLPPGPRIAEPAEAESQDSEGDPGTPASEEERTADPESR